MEKVIFNSVVNAINSNINVLGQMLREGNKEVFWDDLDELYKMKEYLSKLDFKFRKNWFKSRKRGIFNKKQKICIVIQKKVVTLHRQTKKQKFNNKKE